MGIYNKITHASILEVLSCDGIGLGLSVSPPPKATFTLAGFFPALRGHGPRLRELGWSFVQKKKAQSFFQQGPILSYLLPFLEIDRALYVSLPFLEKDRAPILPILPFLEKDQAPFKKP